MFSLGTVMDQRVSSHMDRALELARSVLGTTSPNPAVGCVIVKEGVVVAEGATQPPGGPHAEKVALARAGPGARGATIYVTLEPCRHFGRTPPCTDAIIAAGVAEVHMSVLDPNPLVGGGGKRRLEEAGVKTLLGEGEGEARRLNEAFFKWITTKRPFVYAKFAMSLDGKIATVTGDSRWIPGGQARAHAHGLRAVMDSIMAGVGTVVRDDPRLTARDGERVRPRQPLRVVVDSRARTPPMSRLLGEPGRALVAVTDAAPPAARRALERAGAEVVVLPARDGRVDLDAVLVELGRRDVINVLVEGGGEVLGSLFAAGLADRVMAYVAPVIIGGRAAPTPVGGLGVERMAQALRLRDVSVERLGDDFLVSGYTGA